MNAVYVTGSKQKAQIFNQALGIELPHAQVDVAEIQSLDVKEVVAHKAKEAFRVLKRPVLVEDTTFVLDALGNFPGPLIKWMLAEIGCEGIIAITNTFANREAIAGSAIAYYDGVELKIFESQLAGTIAHEPRGNGGWGFDQIFIADGNTKTQAELTPTEYREIYCKIKPFSQVKAFLETRM